MQQKGLVEYQLVEDSHIKADDLKVTVNEALNEEDKTLISRSSPTTFFGKIKYQCKQYCAFLSKHQVHVCTGLSVLFSIMQLIMYFSLKSERCPFSTDDKCGKQFLIPSLKKWVPMILANCLIVVAQMHMFIQKSTHSRFITAYGLLQSLYLFYFDDHTINLHIYIGAMNALHIVFSNIFLVIYFMSRLWVKLYRKNKKYCIIGTILLLTVFTLYFYNSKVAHSCDYWSQGINGQIEDKEGSCSIPVPPYCWYKITHHWQDISILFPTCDAEQANTKTKDTITRFYSPAVGDSRYIGFTNLNKHSELDRTDERMQQTVFNSAKGYRTLKEAEEDKHDVILDREEQQYNISIKFNKTLSQERQKIVEELKEQSIAKNVLLIFIDAVSRQSMHLKLPKTVEWFEQNARQHSYKPEKSQKKEAKKETRESYEFYKFNSFKPFTFDNLQTFFYGQRLRDVRLPDDQKLVPVSEFAKQQGYVTGHTSDYCQTISLGIDEETMELMKSVRYDHETQSYSCDPNYYDPDSSFSLFQGPYSLVRRCLYGVPLAEYPIQYTKSFWETYPDNKKFFHLEFMYGHEGSGEVVNHLDQYLSHFLNDMSDSGLLKDTVVILFNDHGLHMQGLFYLLHLQNVFIEINLPGLFISLPPEINEKHGEQIALNQQNLVSIFNLHHLFMHLIKGESYENAQNSLFNSQDDQKSCGDIHIEQAHCSCK